MNLNNLIKKERIIPFQYFRKGLNHKVIVKDIVYPDGLQHTTLPYSTLCGKSIYPGQGGWGYGPKACAKCLKAEAPHRKRLEYLS